MTQLPAEFISMIGKYPVLSELSHNLLTDPDISVRINPAKGEVCDLPFDGKVPWCAEGYYLSRRPQFTFDPRLHQGRYYVQDASSMAITAVIREITGGSPVHYLDACAAPGGKTTAALSVLPAGSVVVANEFDYRRAEILAENLSKWGSPNVVVSRGDTKRFRKLISYFDIVAVDAPCSGEGMMRKDPQAVEQWSQSLVSQCAVTQREIIDNVWHALKPGGYLIYSTCTFNLTEDEECLSWIIDNYGALPVRIPSLEDAPGVVTGIDTPHPCYRFIPGHVRGEGLFITVVRKPGDVPVNKAYDKKTKSSATDKHLDKSPNISRWFNMPIALKQVDNELYAMPLSNAAFMASAASKLDTILVGVHAATIKGKDVMPTHELALSLALEQNAFDSVDLDYDQAIKYLQRDNVSLPDGTPKGMILLKYDGWPLGFVKNLGNRANTLMPKHWRILSRLK